MKKAISLIILSSSSLTLAAPQVLSDKAACLTDAVEQAREIFRTEFGYSKNDSDISASAKKTRSDSEYTEYTVQMSHQEDGTSKTYTIRIVGSCD